MQNAIQQLHGDTAYYASAELKMDSNIGRRAAWSVGDGEVTGHEAVERLQAGTGPAVGSALDAATAAAAAAAVAEAAWATLVAAP